MIDSASKDEEFRRLLSLAKKIPSQVVDIANLQPMDPDCIEVGQMTSVLWAKFKLSISCGIVNPVFANCNGLVVDGLRRIIAARTVGLTQVPCVTLPINEEEFRILRVLMNPFRKPVGDAKKITWRHTAPSRIAFGDRAQMLSRAKKTIEARAANDLRLQEEIKKYEGSLEDAAIHALNSMRCIEAIDRRTRRKIPTLDFIRRSLSIIIKKIVSTGISE